MSNTTPVTSRSTSTPPRSHAPETKPLPRWTAADIPPQRGRLVVITGTGGIGFEDALALTRAGADVVLAGRNPVKGAASGQPRLRGRSVLRLSISPVSSQPERSLSGCAPSTRSSTSSSTTPP